MFNEATIDLITHNKDLSEFAMYLVEDDPWENVEARLKKTQNRVYTVIDFVLDGQFASDYPDSRGKRVRIEVVCRGEKPPTRFEEVVLRLNRIIHSEGDYAVAIKNTTLVTSLQVTYSEEVRQS